ncbi:MAG: family 1 extracellular solute-binding protein [Paenibacillus sp.]|nr:family 1 extracellular solute-binding protein [Paenibacillus sp.]
MKSWIYALSITIVATLLTACGKSEPQDAEPKASSAEPVTLTFYQHASISDAEIEKFVVEPVKKKYPHISFNVIRNGTDTKPEMLIAGGIVPDLIYTTNHEIVLWRDLKVPEDLNELTKTYKMDLSKFEPNIMDSIITYSGGDGKRYGIPVMQNIAAMFYNKTIFDKFAAKYPNDLMTWNEVMALARKVTATDGGVQYVGLALESISRTAFSLSLPYMNPTTQKAAIHNDSWKKVYSLMKETIDIPGYRGTTNKFRYNLVNDFYKTGNVAMATEYVPDAISNVDWKAAETIDWDIVSLPNFEGETGTSRVVAPHVMMINSQSKQKDSAFKAISVFASDEVQTELNKNGKISALTHIVNNSKEYASYLPTFKGKNVTGIFKAKPRKIHSPITEYDALVRSAIDGSINDLAAGKDMNTILRETEEKANKSVESAIAAKGNAK